MLFAWIIVVHIGSTGPVTEIAWTLFLVCTIFLFVVIHELAHSLVARKHSIKADSITLLPIGGVAQMGSLHEKPQIDLKISLAGPAINLVFALICWGLLGFQWIDTAKLDTTRSMNNFLLFVMQANAMLGFFNLIPAFPLDGGRALRAGLAMKMEYSLATSIAAAISQGLGFLLIFFGFTYSLFLIFIGIFIIISSQSERYSVGVRAFIHKYTAGEATIKEIPVLNIQSTLADASRKLLNTQNKNFVIFDGDFPVGTISRDEIIIAFRESGAHEYIRNVRFKRVVKIPETTPLDTAIEQMKESGSKILLVSGDDDIKGILEEDNIHEFMLLKSGPRAA